MTEETHSIARLDRSKPPPGYEVGRDGGGDWYWIRGPEGAEGHRGDMGGSETEVVAAAWAHYETRHDPPGIVPAWDDEPGIYLTVAGGCLLAEGGGHDPETEARAVAWTWYWRRAEIAAEWDWPRALTWSDEQVAEAAATAALKASGFRVV